MKAPYQLVAATQFSDRVKQMDAAVARGYPRLGQVPIREGDVASIACYGPSLADTWQDLRHPIISMSGATRFLADRGVIADFHCDMDPRPHKVRHLEPPVPGVTYLMASVCPPKTWDVLAGQRVVLWHTTSGAGTAEWIAQHDPGTIMVTGGSSIGLTALHLAGVLGFRRFEIHGMDNSKRGGARHAGPHYGHPQGGITWQANHVVYDTSRIMANACAEMLNYIDHYPIICVLHGDGLMQALVRKHNAPNACCADDVEKATRLRASTVEIYDTTDPLAAQIAVVKQALGHDEVCDLTAMYAACEAWRERAVFNTGSVTLDACLTLRAICHVFHPTTVAEVGTFIGRTAFSMKAATVYTCDKDNDCLPKQWQPTTSTVVPFVKCTSTDMLTRLQGRTIDLFFFDGRIQDQDVPLILSLSHPNTVYVFDDFKDAEKGVINCRKLWPHLPTYRRTRPSPLWGDTTLAVLSPAPQAGGQL